MQPKNQPESSKRIKDMDTRPNPIHIDDFEITDPNEKWIPGNRHPVRPQKEGATPKTEEEKAVTQGHVANSIEQLHKIIVLVIALAVLVGIVLLAIWVGDVYNLDLPGKFHELIGKIKL